MRFHTTERLSERQSLTREGFLLCAGVPIARTGLMLYGPGELQGVEAGPDGLVMVTRHPDDVFAETTIASFGGKPVTNDHPDEDVTPATWRTVAVGSVQNVRRGEGVMDDFLIADLLITDAEAIEAVRDGKREVSCGYDADYEQLEPGKARQHNIIGNHVALVEQGRCGPRCAIGDRAMSVKTKGSILDRLKAAIRSKDEGSIAKVLGEMDEAVEPASGSTEGGTVGAGGETHVHVHLPAAAAGSSVQGDEGFDPGAEPLIEGAGAAGASQANDAPSWFKDYSGKCDSRFDAIEATLKGLSGGNDAAAASEAGEEEESADEAASANEGEEAGERADEGDKGKDKAKDAARDSAGLAATFQATVALAEILAPGVKMPTFDAKVPAAKTIDALCAFRRKALLQAHGTDDGKAIIDALAGAEADFPVALKAMTCDAARILFNGAADATKRENNLRQRAPIVSRDASTVTPKTPAEINKANREFYSR